VQGSTAYADLENALPGGGDGRITIAVLDGPVDLAHPCFAGARLTELQTLAAGSVGGRALAHGTHVASVIFGQPGSAVRGIAPACRGLIAPIFSDGGSGLTCSQLDLARAILLAVEHGAHIINISGGQLSDAGEADSLLGDALAKCEAAGVLVVAAAGNDGCDCSHIPACMETVLAVGAADKNGAPLPFSNWGVAYQATGILAPGEAIEGAAPGGGTVRRTGSSFAAAIVSGLSGRKLAEQLAHGERPNPLRLRRILIGTATPGDPGVDQLERFLAGRLNVAGVNRELSGGRPNMSMSGMVQEHESPPGSPLGPSSLAADTNIGFTAGDPGAIRQSGAVAASDCGCGCGGEKKECGCGGANKAAGQDAPQLVYVLGQIGYDFGTEARRDSIRQFMAPGSEMRTAN
jgi:cyanobactin maturation PatA/PatG family protease